MRQKKLYNLIQNFRAKHYTLFRKIIDNKIIQYVFSKLFGKISKKVRTPEGYYIYVNPVYHSQFYSEGSILQYEPEIRTIFNSFLQEGMVVYDIGANIGIFSLLFVKKVGASGMVYAFEPEENNYAQLKLTQEYNNFKQLKIEFCCVDEYSGMQFFDRRGGAFSGRIVASGSMDHNHSITRKQSISIDDYIIFSNNPPPDIVKIDVEGHEYKVLCGMRKTLIEKKPLIILELHKNLCNSISDIYELFISLGYKCYNLYNFNKSEPTPLKRDAFCQAFHIIAKKG